MDKYKYTRTYHLPITHHATSDDKHIDIAAFTDRILGKEVVVTIKMDGENTSLYSNGDMHARSIDSRHHDSRNWVKKFWGERYYKLPDGWRVCGENIYALHSIAYESLPSYFMAFAIFDEKNNRLNWDEFILWCDELDIEPVTVVDRFVVSDGWLDRVSQSFESVLKDGQEGIVMTTVDGFPYDDHHLWLGKAVREGHVQTDQHWMSKEVVLNKLKYV